MGTTSRRHHILPVMYQRRFSTNPDAKIPQVDVFDMKKGIWRTQSVLNTAVQRDYYSIKKGNTGLSSDDVEKWLGQIESESATIFTKKFDKQKSIGPDEKEIIGLFVSTLRMRNPFIREKLGNFVGNVAEKIAFMIHQQSVRDPSYFQAMLKEFKNDTGEDVSTLTPESLDPKSFIIKAVDEPLIGLSFSHVVKTAFILSKMHWTIFQAPNGMRFLTSDNPYFEINPLSKSFSDRGGLFNPKIEITLPLSSNQFLFISHQKTTGGMYRFANKRQWEVLNQRVIMSSQNLIITSSRNFNADEIPLQGLIEKKSKK